MKSENSITKQEKNIFFLFCFFLLSCLLTSIWKDSLSIVALPFAVLFIFLLIFDYVKSYYLLIASIPITINLSLGSFTVDVPSEPLMLSLVLIFPFIIFLRLKDFTFIRHPFILLILAHLVWMIFISFYSVSPVVSLKYILAKIWYIVPFIFFTCLIIAKVNDFKKIFWSFFIPLLVVCLYTSFRHGLTGFTFGSSNTPMNPFFSNHVTYSATIAVFLPFTFIVRNWYPPNTFKRSFITAGIIILLFSIAVSYTRASWLSVLLLMPTFLLVKIKMVKPAIAVTCIAIISFVIYLDYNNNYLKYSIDYKKVIFNKGNIEKHLEATVQMEDISGMERVYRWVAAKNMIAENFWLGTGPNTFHPEYKKYTVNSFYTYVSDNPEQSTTHNYFLMIFCEQGILGFLLFTILYIWAIVKSSHLYLVLKDPRHKALSIGCALSLIALLVHLALNDLIETDEIGSLFFITIALIVKLDYWKKEESNQEIAQEI